MMQSSTEAGRTFRSRPFRRPFAEVPRYWFGDNAVSTHLVNAINLLFPDGERFFVRSVRKYEDRIEDPELRRQIRAFYAQEGRHANAHERYFESMRAQGYSFERILDVAKWLLVGGLPGVRHPMMRLSVTVALEHYTAIMAELVYTNEYFTNMDPTMRDLLLWHAAEEIEHKAVAFDVLAEVNPSYALRMGGFALATFGLVLMWTAGTASLLYQDHLPMDRVLRDLREVLDRSILGERIFWRALKEYVARDFHPLQRDNYSLVRDYIERFEAELGGESA